MGFFNSSTIMTTMISLQASVSLSDLWAFDAEGTGGKRWWVLVGAPAREGDRGRR
jgi:hypothetical protein